jgi:ribose 5-phosphate isomerase B
MKKDLTNSKGILICKNGAGVCIAANKFKGIRAAATFSKNHTSSLISDDNINIICLPSEYLKPDEIKQIIQTFQTEEFKPENRHLRRLGKVSIIENSNL